MNQLIAALKRRMVDEQLTLDRQQTTYLLFFLYELLEHERSLKDGVSYKYALLDLLGSLPDGKEEVA